MAAASSSSPSPTPGSAMDEAGRDSGEPAPAGIVGWAWLLHDRGAAGQAFGGTLLRMTHSGLPNAAQCASHERGWAHYMARLAMAAAGQNPGIDRGAEARAAT